MGKGKLIMVGILVIILALGAFSYYQGKKPGKYDDFAKCLTAKDAIFYGAFWCPHCAEQKRMFGNSIKFAPYRECSTPDRRGQLQFCIDANVTSYPTWEFADGSRLDGVVPLATLAQKTGCSVES